MRQSDHSLDYHRLRESQEREMAEQATDEAVRQIHLELAEQHRRLADETERHR